MDRKNGAKINNIRDKNPKIIKTNKRSVEAIRLASSLLPLFIRSLNTGINAVERVPAITNWKIKSGSFVEAKYTPTTSDAPKMLTKSLCLTKPKIWEKTTVPISINEAWSMLV